MRKFSCFAVSLLAAATWVSPCWADNIESVAVGNEEPMTITVNGSFSDDCARDPLLLLTQLPAGAATETPDRIIAQIFTLPPGEGCNAAEVPFTLSREVSTPAGDRYEALVMLYQGFPSDEAVTLVDEETVRFGFEDDVEEPEIIEADIDIKPEKLNINRNARYLVALIEPTADYALEDIDTESLVLSVDIEGLAQEFPVLETMLNTEDDKLVVLFDNREVVQFIRDQGTAAPRLPFTVSGSLSDSTMFEGTEMVRIIDPGNGHHGSGHSMR